MQYLGRFMQGQEIPLAVQVLDANRAPALPEDAPHALVLFNEAVLGDFRLHIINKFRVAGLFGLSLPVDSRFPIGRYHCQITWPVGGSKIGTLLAWDVIAGGDPKAQGISLYHYTPPTSGSSYLLLQTTEGSIYKKANPRLE